MAHAMYQSCGLGIRTILHVHHSRILRRRDSQQVQLSFDNQVARIFAVAQRRLLPKAVDGRNQLPSSTKNSGSFAR